MEETYIFFSKPSDTADVIGICQETVSNWENYNNMSSNITKVSLIQDQFSVKQYHLKSIPKQSILQVQTNLQQRKLCQIYLGRFGYLIISSNNTPFLAS